MSSDSSFSSKLVKLPHSDRQPVPHANKIGKADGERQIRVSVILNRKAPLDLKSLNGRHISRAELNEKYGASQKDYDMVWAFAQAHGLKVDEKASSLERRRVELRGPISAFNEAFGVEMHDYESKDTKAKARFHAIEGPVQIPQSMVNSVEAVLGLDNRPIAKPHMRLRPATSTTGTFTPPQVAQVYDFPTAGKGVGQTIGIIELGGGYTTTDIANYFKQLGIAAPKVTAVILDGGSNAPTTPDSADGEVMLDIEVAGSVAPGANIAVYFTTNTDQGFQDAISTAIHDTANDPSVLSISWGGPESSWAQSAMNAMDTTCQSAAALGVSITVASGDNGSSDGTNTDAVDFPASSPHVLACGGTKLVASNGQRSETVWNDQPQGGASGGGYSKVFPVPTWQTAAVSVPSKKHKKHEDSSVAVAEHEDSATKVGRGVPDVSGDASPETGYQILVDGQQMVVGGTSAVAPLWAGLIALINEQLNKQQAGKRVGLLNPEIYPLGETPFYDITSGDNGSQTAGKGWDACTGLGSPNGQQLLKSLQAAS
jgi:kumamolisin